MKLKWYEKLVILLTWGLVGLLWIVIIILAFTALPYLFFEWLGGGC